MKKILTILCCLSLMACAQRMADDAGDDDGQHQPDPDPDPNPDHDPVACDDASDCNDNVACNRGVCTNGTCSYVSECTGGQVCDVADDRCETPTTPTSRTVSCFETGGTLYLTISGHLLDAVYGGSLANPKFISVASDQIAGSWNVNASTTAPKVVLSDAERSSGTVASASINLPSSQAQRFTLMVWSDDSGGYARRFDLADWTVSGDGCARIADGAAAGSTDGYVIGRAPLCPNACDDGNASTSDVCSATGCTHGGGTTTPGNGTLSCVEGSGVTTVTVGAGILSHLFTDGLTPNSSWSIRFGYGGTDSEPWVSDGVSYALTMPNSTVGFNLVLRSPGGTDYWFDVDEFDVSGTCARKSDNTEFVHTQPTNVSTYGSLTCQLTTETGSLKRKVTIDPDTGRDIRDALTESPAPLPSPSVIQYGGSDGWQLPYPSVGKPQLTWNGGTDTYVFYLDPSVDDFNFFVVDNDDPTDSWNGGDFFDLDRWRIVNVGSAGCVRYNGGISIN
jgi:hypothetical protein